MQNPQKFLEQLQEEVEEHVGVTHPFLCRLSQVPFTREDYLIYGLQHFPLISNFTSYMEWLLLSAQDSNTKKMIAKVLVDEYGEGSDDKDHSTLYLEFLRAAGCPEGVEFNTPLHEAVTGFIEEHYRIVKNEHFLVGLGALGPGHEWSIPKMFPKIVRGLRMAGFEEKEILYFTLHLEQDVEHGEWLWDALLTYAGSPENQKLIRRGAMLSLSARDKFWHGVQSKIVGWRQPKKLHFRPNGTKAGNKKSEETYSQFKNGFKQSA